MKTTTYFDDLQEMRDTTSKMTALCSRLSESKAGDVTEMFALMTEAKEMLRAVSRNPECAEACHNDRRAYVFEYDCLIMAADAAEAILMGMD